MNHEKFIDPDILNKIKHEYIYDHLSIYNLSLKYGMHHSVLKRRLEMANIPIKKVRCEYNENFFEKIDTEEKSYILGFIYADGGVAYNDKNKTGMSLKITLSDIDEEILIKFRDILAPQKQLRYSIKNGFFETEKDKKFRHCHLNINNTKICKDLIELGCVINKSLVLKFPKLDTIPKELLNHFVRGYFDGDGCISNYYTNRKYSYKGKHEIKRTFCTNISIASSEFFLNSLRKFLKSELNINSHYQICPSHGKITVLRIGGNVQIDKFLSWLYQNSHIYLQRKYNKYLEFKEKRTFINSTCI